jgi:hypothetical protein
MPINKMGSAKIIHRHIVEVGLSLLAHAHIPLKYWDEAFLAATYLINRLPTKVLCFSTPPPSVSSKKNQTTKVFKLSGVLVGRILDLSTLINPNFESGV